MRKRLSKVTTISLGASLLFAFGMAPMANASTKAQKTLKISNTKLTGSVGTQLKVTTSGGSGSGAVKFTVKGAGCTIGSTSGELKATAATTCTVTAVKAASGAYKAATSAAVKFVFSLSQAPLRITNTTLTGEVGTPIIVTAAGGSGSGAVTFNTTGAVCSINSSTGALTAGAVGSCPVTASKAGSGKYPAITSAPVTFHFGVGTQATLTIANTTLTGSVGTPLAVTVSGGSGTGAVTYSVTGTGCTIDPASGALSDTAAGTCVVTATKAADANYQAASSAPVTFTFAVGGGGGGGDTPTFSNPDSATLTSITGTDGAQINDTVNGDAYFINQYYSATDHWYENYIDAGATVTMTWQVDGANGQPLASQPVTLTDNLAYACAVGTTWTDANLNINPGCGGGTEGTETGTTNANGVVSFTVTNTNTVTGTRPADMTTTGGAEANEKVYDWTRFVLVIGTDTITANPNTTVDQATDLVDLIVIPKA